jgi:hypothetical protein
VTISPHGVCFWLTIDLPGFFFTGGRAGGRVGAPFAGPAFAALAGPPGRAVETFAGPDLLDADGPDLRWAMDLPFLADKGNGIAVARQV